MSFCSLKRMDSSGENTSQQMISQQQRTADFNNRKENQQESQMYQGASTRNDLLGTNANQEVSNGRSNFQLSTNFQPRANFQPTKNFQPSGKIQKSGNYPPSGTAFSSSSSKLQASSAAFSRSIGNFQASSKLQASSAAFSSSTANFQASSTNFLSSSKLDAASSRRRLEEFNEKLRVLNKEVSEKRIEAAVMSVEEALSINTHWMEKMQRATDVMNACRDEMEGPNIVAESSEMEM